MDAPLSATLQFSTPLANTISTWPAQSAEMTKKLKKAQKQLPAFGWDTEPVVGSEEVIEEAFLDVFCDLIYGGGWMDLERGEMLDRDCNWALVSFHFHLVCECFINNSYFSQTGRVQVFAAFSIDCFRRNRPSYDYSSSFVRGVCSTGISRTTSDQVIQPATSAVPFFDIGQEDLETSTYS